MRSSGPSNCSNSKIYAIAASGPVVVSASKMSLKGSGTITLVSGGTSVSVSGGGISIEGASKVEFNGNPIIANGEALGF